MFSMFFILFLLSMILILLTLIISKKNKSAEKFSPFECGFDLIFNLRTPFSMKFFLIAIIFLIFDIEIAFFFPMVINLYFTKFILWLKSMTLFLFILNWGLFHEWLIGSLKWKN